MDFLGFKDLGLIANELNCGGTKTDAAMDDRERRERD